MIRKNREHIELSKLTRIAGLLVAMLLFSSCSKGSDEDEGKVDSSGPKEAEPKKIEDKHSSKTSGATEEVSKKIENVTGNHSKLAWYQYLGKSSDSLGNGNQLQLWGIDTRDGLGARVILKEKSSYARPLISPDGKWILYTNKHTERKNNKKKFKPVVHRVDWKGGQGEELGKGYAVDVWKDPKSKLTWVYVANLIPTDRASMYADKLERFQLDDPEKREVVWDKTKISVDSIQLSGDGKRASCLFPWPDVGVMDLEKMEYWRNQHGCWPSLAPDDSYIAWVFDGSHKSVHLFADRGKKLSVVQLNDGPDMGGHEMYHPRWANHPRFITVTGPYIGPSIGKSGKEAEVYIGEFGEGLKSIKNWVKVTDNKKGDHYPDLWIKGGEKETLGKISGAESAVVDPDAVMAKTWPPNREGLHFLWEKADGQNQVGSGKSQRMCGVEARHRARFGRNFEMLTGGGYFEADAISSPLIAERLVDGDFAIQLQLSSHDPKQSGMILSTAEFQIQQDANDLVFLTKEQGYSLGNVEANTPIHLAVSFQKGKWQFFRDGGIQISDSISKRMEGAKGVAGLTVGDGKWEGQVNGLAVYGRGLTEGEAAASFASLGSIVMAGTAASNRIQLQGKLVEMTAERGVEELDTYRRALLVYTYEVEKIIRGKFDQPKVYVNHWSIMDRKPLKSIKRELGKSYTLEIEPMNEHPELESERRWFDGLALEEHFDVTTPAP